MGRKWTEQKGEYTVSKQSHSNGMSVRVSIENIPLDRTFFNDADKIDEWVDGVIARFEAARTEIRSDNG